jgi:hypothetical protein
MQLPPLLLFCCLVTYCRMLHTLVLLVTTDLPSWTGGFVAAVESWQLLLQIACALVTLAGLPSSKGAWC